jgi:low affinity Fe/Cu permease
MLTYFDLTFFAVMKYVEGNTSTDLRKYAEVVSYVIITLSVVLPLFIMTIVCRRYEVMKIKQAKESFNTVVLKIDKQSRWRLIVPGYFFFRRLLTACLLSMPIDNTFIFLQYVFILMSSHAYVLYLVAIKPYQSPLLNNYVLSNETFYSALIIAIFIFSDATPELHIKLGAAIVLITSIFLLIFANFLMIVILMFKGKAKLKEEIKQSKLKRAEKELMEEEEEEERRQRQKREEEEFTKLPEDTTGMSQYDLNNRADGAGLGEEDDDDGETPEGKTPMKTKKRKGKKGKGKGKKGDGDDMIAFDMTTGEQYTT